MFTVSGVVKWARYRTQGLAIMGLYICDRCNESFPDEEIWPAMIEGERLVVCDDCRQEGTPIYLDEQ